MSGQAFGSKLIEELVKDIEAKLDTLLTLIDVALSTRASQATLASILAQLDVALSTRASQVTVASILGQLDVLLSTRASEATLSSVLGRLDVALSTRASQATLASILSQLDVALSTRASQATLASILTQLDVALSTRASQATVASILAQLDVALSTRASEATLSTLNTKVSSGGFTPVTTLLVNNGDTTLVAAPGAGHKIRVLGYKFSNRSATSLSPRVSLRFGAAGSLCFTATLSASGGMVNWQFGSHLEKPYWEGGDNVALIGNLSAPSPTGSM